MARPTTNKERSQPPLLSRGLRMYLYFTAAVTGAAVLIVEILGAKLLSPYVGTSHFVWTAQIVVTLLALAAGYAAGGKLADRTERLRPLYGCLIAAAAYLGLSNLVLEPIAFYCLRFQLAIGALLAAGLLFFVPLLLLAMTGPFFIRRLTSSVEEVGSNAGRVSSVSTLGSVAGAVLIGYVLIPLLPNPTTLLLTACGLVVVALGYFLVWDRGGAAAPGVLGLLGLGLAAMGAIQPWLRVPTDLVELERANSNFGMIQVVEDTDHTRRYYLNDLLTQNGYEPSQGRSASLFTYMLRDLARGYRTNIEDVLCIGVGVGIVPREFAEAGAKVRAVEINPAIVPIAEKYFGFDPSKLALTIGDGRYYLEKSKEKFDVIILDAFLGESPPSHLMTREAFGSMKRLLKPGGVLVMNAFGELEKGFTTASLYITLQKVFPSVRLHAGGNGNLFYAASDQPSLVLQRVPDFSQYPAYLQHLARLTLGTAWQPKPEDGKVLTDAYNPVEFYDAKNREAFRKRLARSFEVTSVQ
jgi:spermidine synthase